ncbi:MAG: hypothetical protein IJV69_00525, partial [Kiritimatiellae bacterium]|nr:hypothetical protein [Kiritimatiellia bacterium]
HLHIASTFFKKVKINHNPLIFQYKKSRPQPYFTSIPPHPATFFIPKNRAKTTEKSANQGSTYPNSHTTSYQRVPNLPYM